MVETIVLAATAPALIAAFLMFRVRAFPSEPPVELTDQRAAIARAVEAVRRLCGLDVDSWQAFAVVWFDDATAEQLYQRDVADQARPFLARWGMRGSWRIRFVQPGGSVLIGLSPDGGVVLFDLLGDAYDRAAAGAGPGGLSDDDLRQRLGRVWTTVAPVGAGYRERSDGVTEQTRRFRATGTGLLIDFSVQTVGGAVVRVDSVTEVTAAGAHDAELAEQRDAVFTAGGLLGSVLAFGAGVAILVSTDGAGLPWLAAALALPLVAAILFTERSGLRYAAVQAHDGTVGWRTFRVLNGLLAGVSATAMIGVVVVAALAGTVVAATTGIPIVDDPGRQLIWGGWFAVAWLALVTVGYATLNRLGVARVTPAVDKRSVRTAGVDVPHVLAVATQSSVGEEAVFRLLAVPVVVWATGSPVVAAAVTALLWAGMHSGGVVRPRWIRFTELSVAGLALGLMAVHVGMVAAFVAHALYNAIILAAPLIGGRRADTPALSPTPA